MRRSSKVVLLVTLLTPSVFAKTLYLCHTPSYNTISSALAAAPAGTIIAVCPGTYAELFITQPRTIQGITSSASNGELARIVMPTTVPGGPTNWQLVNDPGWFTVAPQVFVSSPAGTVQITNLTIDGTVEVGAVPCAFPSNPIGGDPPSPIRQTTGIYSYSPVKINEVTTIGQGQNNGCGVGILAEASPANDSVSITHSLVQNPSLDGEVAGSMTISLTHTTVVLPPVPICPGAQQAAVQSSAISARFHRTPSGRTVAPPRQSAAFHPGPTG